MKERKGGAMVALGITLAVCFLSVVGHWILVDWQNWPVTGVLIVLEIFAGVFLSSVKNVRENRSMIRSICLGFCFIMIVVAIFFGRGAAI